MFSGMVIFLYVWSKYLTILLGSIGYNFYMIIDGECDVIIPLETETE